MEHNPWAPGPPAPPSSSRTPLIIGLAVGLTLLLVLLVAAAVFVYALFKTRDTARSQITYDEVVMHQEPGSGAPVRYGNTPVFDACSLVTTDHLSSLGVKLEPTYRVGHTRLDGDVPPEAALTLEGSDPISKCFYMLSNNNALFVRVHQTPFNSADELTRLQQRATYAEAPVRTENGLSLASWHDSGYKTQHILIWRPELLVDISFKTEQSRLYGTLDIAGFALKLETLARNGISSGPTAPVRHVYSAPLDKLKDPCEVVSRDAFARAYPTSTGAPSMMDGSYSLDANGISCTRTNIVPGKEQYRALEVELFFWDNEIDANGTNKHSCEPSHAGVPVPVTPSVGTGRTCLAPHPGSGWALEFQVDTTNVAVKDGTITGSNATSSERRDQFVPAAQAIVAAGLFR